MIQSTGNLPPAIHRPAHFKMISVLEIFLMYVAIPLWIIAGIVDWLTHRASNIQQNAGSTESILHIILVSQMAVPIIGALFLEINAAFFLMTAAALLAHQITIYIDLNYAYTKRKIGPVEQMIHGVQEMIPYMATILLAILHWRQFTALFGMTEAADFTFRIKQVFPPMWYIASLVLSGGLVFLLFVEELIRCLKFSKAARKPIATL